MRGDTTTALLKISAVFEDPSNGCAAVRNAVADVLRCRRPKCNGFERFGPGGDDDSVHVAVQQRSASAGEEIYGTGDAPCQETLQATRIVSFFTAIQRRLDWLRQRISGNCEVCGCHSELLHP